MTRESADPPAATDDAAAPPAPPPADGGAARPRRRSPLRPRWTELSTEQRRQVHRQLFYEGPELVPYLRRFSMLMVLSVVIAALGLVGDSAAVVIGAMLVAPLMTPVLSLAAALVMAWPRRQLGAALLVAAASVGAIAVAWLVSAVLPAERFAEMAPELLARTRPTLLDLGIGIAAGAAGAYVTVRVKSAAAIPGVAIAVALVPPLAAVGILMQRDQGHLAGQAMLLYLTNLAAIVLAAGITFLATGFTPHVRAELMAHRIRLGLVSALVAVALVSYPLGRRSADVVGSAKRLSAITEEVGGWVGDRDLEVQGITLGADGDEAIVVDLTGPQQPPPVAALAAAIAGRVDHPVEVTVRFTRRNDIRGSASPP